MTVKPRTPANPEIWGTGAWTLLHCITATYPLRARPSIQQRYREFLTLLSQTLPCKKCRRHFRTYLRRSPPCLRTRQAFKKWMIDFHNWVNERLGKPILTHETAEILMRRQCERGLIRA